MLPCIGHGSITVQANDQAMLPTIMQCCEHACLTRRRRHAPATCIHAYMMACGPRMSLHGMLGPSLPPTTWQQLGIECVMMLWGLGCHAKAILCMGGIHVSAVLPACMPPPIMGASKASNRLRSKFLRGWTSEGSVQAITIGGRLPEKLLRCNSLIKCCMTRFAVFRV